MKTYYPAMITYDEADGRYLVQFPDFPEALTEGRNEKEACDYAAEVLTLTLEGRIAERKPIPRPSQTKNMVRIAPAPYIQTALQRFSQRRSLANLKLKFS